MSKNEPKRKKREITVVTDEELLLEVDHIQGRDMEAANGLREAHLLDGVSLVHVDAVELGGEPDDDNRAPDGQHLTDVWEPKLPDLLEGLGDGLPHQQDQSLLDVHHHVERL